MPVSSNQQASNIFKGIKTYFLYNYNYNKQGYEEATTITGGIAYWLGMLDTTTITVEDSPTAKEIILPLKPGWNMIGCPFSFAPDWSKVLVEKDGVKKGLTDAVKAGWVMDVMYGYENGNYQLAYGIKPWGGYWFAALSSCNLIVPNTGVREENSNLLVANSLQTAPLETTVDTWQVGLHVTAGEYKDEANYGPRFGVSRSSSSGLDSSDRPEPPEPQGGFVTLYFTHPAEGIFNRFDWDMRSPGSTTVWEFEVKTNLSGEGVVITWDKGCLPQGYCLVLIDKDTQTSMVMDKENGYTYACPQDDGLSVRHFMVRATKAEATEVQAVKAGGPMKIWPNPATTGQKMTFEGITALKILTLTGELVKDVSGIQAGYEWKLDNDDCEPVASGLYIYIISDGLETSRVGRVAVIR